MHRGEHVPHQCKQFVVEGRHPTGRPVHDWVSPAEDWEDRSASPQLIHGADLRGHAGEGTAWRAWNTHSRVSEWSSGREGVAAAVRGTAGRLLAAPARRAKPR